MKTSVIVYHKLHYTVNTIYMTNVCVCFDPLWRHTSHTYHTMCHTLPHNYNDNTSEHRVWCCVKVNLDGYHVYLHPRNVIIAPPTWLCVVCSVYVCEHGRLCEFHYHCCVHKSHNNFVDRSIKWYIVIITCDHGNSHCGSIGHNHIHCECSECCHTTCSPTTTNLCTNKSTNLCQTNTLTNQEGSDQSSHHFDPQCLSYHQFVSHRGTHWDGQHRVNQCGWKQCVKWRVCWYCDWCDCSVWFDWVPVLLPHHNTQRCCCQWRQICPREPHPGGHWDGGTQPHRQCSCCFGKFAKCYHSAVRQSWGGAVSLLMVICCG